MSPVRPGRLAGAILLWACLTLAIGFFLLPIAALLTETTPSDLLASVGDPVSRDALVLSLECSLIALAITVAVGIPAAWLLATRSFRGRALATTIVELPLVMPPAVAGIALLVAFGPRGPIGQPLADAGISLVFETAGVVLALVFVSAPFLIRQAQASFALVDRSILEASRSLGAGELRTLLKVAVPTAAPGLLAGAALAWARALGEFGATLMFAGSLRAVTQTAPLAIYDLFSSDLAAAEALAVILMAVSASLLALAKLVERREQATQGA